MIIFDFAKYTNTIVSSEQKFNEIINFELPQEEQTYDNLYLLSYRILFEEMRNNKIIALKLKPLVRGLRDNSPFKEFIKPLNNELTNWTLLEKLYIEYINNRARKYSPKESIIHTFCTYESEIIEENHRINNFIEKEIKLKCEITEKKEIINNKEQEKRKRKEKELKLINKVNYFKEKEYIGSVGQMQKNLKKENEAIKKSKQKMNFIGISIIIFMIFA